MEHDISADDEGKRVETADGDVVGMVETVHGSTAHVKRDDSLSRSIRRRLGWDDDTTDTFELDTSKIASIDQDRIQLRENL